MEKAMTHKAAKTCLTLFLALTMFLVAPVLFGNAGVVYAAEIQSGDGWVLDDAGTLTILKDIDAEDYHQTADPQAPVYSYEWIPYADQIKEVVVAEGVTEVPVLAFAAGRGVSYNNLQKVTMSSTVKTIGASAFCDVSSLKEVSLNEGLELLGITAFSGTGVEEIRIPEGVVYQSDVFTYCPNLKYAVVSAGATCQGNAPFYGCESLEYVVVEEGVESIPDQFVSGCGNLKYVWLPKSLTTLGDTDLDAGFWDAPIKTGCIIGYTGSLAEQYVEHWQAMSSPNVNVTFHAVDGDQHNWDSGVVTVEPTAEAEGVKTYTCAVCGATKTEPVAALGTTGNDNTNPPSSGNEADGQTPVANSASADATSPKTGDSARPLAYFAAAIASAGIAGVILWKKAAVKK